MHDDTRFDAIQAYLVGLYGAEPHGLIWIGGQADHFKGRAFTQIIDATAYAVSLDRQGGQGVYHRSTTLTRADLSGRGKAEDSAAVYYFALDFDVKGPGHKADGLPESADDLKTLIEVAGFPAPTAVVHSGGGFYPQWRFTQPIDVRDEETRTWVAGVFAEMSDHFIRTAGGLGWKLDNVRDLARVFRLPGTTNRKAEPVVAGWEMGSGETFDLGVLVAKAVRARPATQEPAPAEVAPTAGDAPFDDPEKQFTTEQAKNYIRTARERLAATTSGFNGAINNFAMACAHFPWLVSREQCAKHVIKALGPSTGWTEADADDRRTIDSAYSATEAGKSWVAVQVEESEQAAEGPLEILPPPGQPMHVARELLQRIPQTDGELHWSWWRDDFYTWTGAHWEVMEKPVVQRFLYQETADAVYLKAGKEEVERMAWAPTQLKIGNLSHALGVGILQRQGEAEPAMAARNGVVVNRELQPHRPSRFNLFSLPFDYDPEASAPAWQRFLDQVLPGDQEAQDFLGEWFGYVISGRTEQQKMAALIGKKRSGKGTVARVLKAVIGAQNVAGLNLGALSGTFGLEPFVGRALAVASDVRWHARNIGDAIQTLLEVTGEDHLTVHRKNKSAWSGQLGTRLMLMSNDTPTFSDRSGALVDRMIYVSFQQSFFGREDVSLTDKLMGELPGILNWALDGLERLDGRGRFTQPASGAGEQEATRRLADPIQAFIDDWCEVGKTAGSISLDHLYLKYRTWCESEGRTKDTTTKEIFSRDLRQKVEGLVSKRRRDNTGKQVTMLEGINSLAV